MEDYRFYKLGDYMMNLKRFIALSMVFCSVLPLVFAQADQRSVDDSYLQDAVELMIIQEQSRADSRDMKMVALEYIGDAIERGNTGEEVTSALEYLAMEGVTSKARENGRLTNNYPDVRTKAATYLGKLGTPEAKTALLKMVYADNEPMVITEAIKSLSNMSGDDKGKAVATIAWVVQKYDVLNPDNLLALSALEAFEKLGASGGGLKDPAAIQMIIRIAEGPYIKPVQNKARQVLNNLRKN
jgi:HEAT repeat protein